MGPKTTIRNVNILDLRRTREETFSRIGRLRNINMLLVSPETAPYLTGIPATNLNAVVEVPVDAELKTTLSELTLNADYLSSLSRPVFLLVCGRIYVDSDVSADLIASKIEGLAVLGKLFCPESIAGILQAKATLMLGKTIRYADDARLVSSSLSLDKGTLESLDDGTYLVVGRSLRVVEDLPQGLFEKKIRRLHVEGSILCRQDISIALKSRLDASRPFTLIPSGHRLIEGNLPLDSLSLGTLQREKLFVLGDILLGEDVTASALDRAIERMAAMGIIICPEKLKDTVRGLCDMLENRTILTQGKLWYVDTDRQLRPDAFHSIDEKITIVVRGTLTLSPDVSPSLFLEHVEKIHNLGDIVCHAEQRSAVEERLGIREGSISEPRAQNDVERENEGPVLGPSNLLVL